MKIRCGPWWCILLQAIAFLLMLAAGAALLMAGFRNLENLAVFSTAMTLALWVVVELPAQARKEGRSLPLRVLICVGMVLSCWLVPELLAWVFWGEVSYWCPFCSFGEFQ